MSGLSASVSKKTSMPTMSESPSAPHLTPQRFSSDLLGSMVINKNENVPDSRKLILPERNEPFEDKNYERRVFPQFA